MAASAPARLALKIGKSPLRFPTSVVDRALRSATLISGREALLSQKPISGDRSAADRIGGFLFSSPVGLGDSYCAKPRRPVTGGDDDAAEKKDDVDEKIDIDIGDIDFSDGDDFSDSGETDYFDDVEDRFGSDSDK